MHLLVDLGNSALKWRLAGSDLAGGFVHGRDWSALAPRLHAALQGRPVSAISIASVAGAEAQAALAPALDAAFGVAPAWIGSGAHSLGVHNAYQDPSRLGIDRWLGVVESWHRYGASVIVDAGSAITVDAVTQDAHHLGGYIVPGLGMLRNSLDSGTGDVRFEDLHGYGIAAGRNTAECVNHGTLLMACAFVREAVVASRQGLPDTCPVIITGGDAPVLAPRLGFAVEVAPDLVLDGLERVSGDHLTGG